MIPLSAALPALAAPLVATTSDGREVVLHDDGTWTPATPEPAGARVGQWTVTLEASAVTGRTLGGATTPNLAGAGYFGITCSSWGPELLFVFSHHGLDEIDVEADYVSFGPRAAFLVPYGERTKKLTGLALTRGTVEAMALPAGDLARILARDPRDELVAEHLRPPREGWPATVRYSLDGFREAWAEVSAACEALD